MKIAIEKAPGSICPDKNNKPKQNKTKRIGAQSNDNHHLEPYTLLILILTMNNQNSLETNKTILTIIHWPVKHFKPKKKKKKENKNRYSSAS